MAEFTPITTQDELDKVLAERLKRERETVRKEYAGYLSPEEAAKSMQVTCPRMMRRKSTRDIYLRKR